MFEQLKQVSALVLNEGDNVATVLADVAKGARVMILGRDGRCICQIEAKEVIPAGHKICVKPVLPGESVVKYGNDIGCAVSGIATGNWVHVHNLASRRGRGDLAAGKGGCA
ncbi:UxaA family hydrolase [Desulfoscipio geothermicus]|uniref:Altronate dehydratase small subunit n=1 Tax=Desulfoscipio geothermicus DSM 3669 TaxID=1121426 RepID=A0A1I6DER4_9FIRM|nr:UxaA family hydrolase [Desulfoscipio geothermicus]SFR03868.1 altronate dehydratase small subunit [Desulfoscipio geothermicus DSM 3669]